jgi:5-methylcytosine-specific restriction endonuclease McrA
VTCGETFTASGKGSHLRTTCPGGACSPKNPRPAATRVCATCGTGFTASGKGSQFRRQCSPSCLRSSLLACNRESFKRRKANERADPEWAAENRQKKRAYERNQLADPAYRERRYKRMSERATERRRTDPEYRFRVRQMSDRRSRVEGAEILPLAPLWAEQDGKCYLCGGQMNPVPVRLGRTHDPLAATIEHRVPISRGGAHDLDNVSLAHYRCNLRKGKRTVAEYEAMRAA